MVGAGSQQDTVQSLVSVRLLAIEGARYLTKYLRCWDLLQEIVIY